MSEYILSAIIIYQQFIHKSNIYDILIWIFSKHFVYLQRKINVFMSRDSGSFDLEVTLVWGTLVRMIYKELRGYLLAMAMLTQYPDLFVFPGGGRHRNADRYIGQGK